MRKHSSLDCHWMNCIEIHIRGSVLFEMNRLCRSVTACEITLRWRQFWRPRSLIIRFTEHAPGKRYDQRSLSTTCYGHLHTHVKPLRDQKKDGRGFLWKTGQKKVAIDGDRWKRKRKWWGQAGARWKTQEWSREISTSREEKSMLVVFNFVHTTLLDLGK